MTSTNETRAAAAALLRGEPIAGPHLVVPSAIGAGRVIPLGEALTVGRGAASDLRLDDPGASRLHLKLVRTGDRYVAEDLGSKNGLRVNGRRLRRPRPLRDGDEIVVGATRLVVAMPRKVAERKRPAPRAEAAAAPAAPPGAAATGSGWSRSRMALLAAAGALLAMAAAIVLVAG